MVGWASRLISIVPPGQRSMLGRVHDSLYHFPADSFLIDTAHVEELFLGRKHDHEF
jgi:hypothetical protein